MYGMSLYDIYFVIRYVIIRYRVFFNWYLPYPIYVNVDSPNLGLPYFNFLGGYQLKKHPVYANLSLGVSNINLTSIDRI